MPSPHGPANLPNNPFGSSDAQAMRDYLARGNNRNSYENHSARVNYAIDTGKQVSGTKSGAFGYVVTANDTAVKWRREDEAHSRLAVAETNARWDANNIRVQQIALNGGTPQELHIKRMEYLSDQEAFYTKDLRRLQNQTQDQKFYNVRAAVLRTNTAIDKTSSVTTALPHELKLHNLSFSPAVQVYTQPSVQTGTDAELRGGNPAPLGYTNSRTSPVSYVQNNSAFSFGGYQPGNGMASQVSDAGRAAPSPAAESLRLNDQQLQAIADINSLLARLGTPPAGNGQGYGSIPTLPGAGRRM